METPKVQTRKNENIITTNVPEQMFGKYLVENLKRKWKEKFLDKDTGEVIEVERTEFVLERGTYLQADQLAVIQFHMQAGDIDGELKVSDQKRLAVFSTGWGLVPWCVTCRISEKNHNFILLARNIFQALDIVTDYVELHYDKSFSITTARGFKSHIFLQDDTTRLQEEDGTEKPEDETEEGKKAVYVFYSIEATVNFGQKSEIERDYKFLVYAKDVEDAKSRIEKYISDTVLRGEKYTDLGYFDKLIALEEIKVNIKTAGTVNCTAVICREFSMQYNPKEEKEDAAPAPASAEASQDGGLFPEEESPQNE